MGGMAAAGGSLKSEGLGDGSCDSLDLDALFEAIDEGNQGFGGGPLGVFLVSQFDQLHGFLALLTPGCSTWIRLRISESN
jgi:hypothetical protein